MTIELSLEQRYTIIENMGDKDRREDLGPLPKADRNAQLQQLSITAFQSLVVARGHRFRDERADDAGVDGSVELLVPDYSNFRAQVQLKATDSEETNQDGTVSLQVSVSNLNYLLNGPSPVYVLYIAPLNELRYLWALDERKRLDQENHRWIQQDSITLRFQNVLTPQVLDEIFQRILNEGRMQRKIQDMLARSSLSENVIVTINPATLAITDPNELHRILLSSGLTIVSAGYSRQVLDQTRLLDDRAHRTPRLKLIQAYASCSLGRFHASLDHLQETLLGVDELSSDDKDFAVYLRDYCEFRIGLIDLADFQRKGAGWAAGSGAQALAYQSYVAYESLLDETDPAGRAAKIQELRSVAKRIEDTDEISHSFKLQARIERLYAEGSQFAFESLQQLGPLAIGRRLGYRSLENEELGRLDEQWDYWRAEANAVVEQATADKHPLLIANAYEVCAAISISRLECLISASSLSDMLPEDPNEVITETKSVLESAIGIYSQADDIDGYLRARMLLSDLASLGGEQAEAEQIAKEVSAKAEAMAYRALKARAEKRVSGDSLFARLESRKAQIAAEDPDSAWDRMTDEELRSLASFGLNIFGLPVERLPVAEKETLSLRNIARERLHWCRHIELLQDLSHAKDRSTLYVSDPNCICKCVRYGYESRFPNQDAGAVVAAFKMAYCADCPGREPKETESDVVK